MAFLTPVRAIPVLLNPTTSTGTGTIEVRGDASSDRPRWTDPDEPDTRGAHESDLKCLAIGADYADFFSSWGALTSVTSVDFMLYTGSPSSVCSPSITYVLTGSRVKDPPARISDGVCSVVDRGWRRAFTVDPSFGL